MIVTTSRLTTAFRTTIPRTVRAALEVQEGDELAYTIEDGRVIVTRAAPARPQDPFAVFSEWSSEADRLGYAAL